MELSGNIFDIDISIHKNKLRCKIVLKDIVFDEFQYAFYLLYNKVRIDTKYYTQNNIVEFQLIHDGIYSVVGFVKYEDKKAIKTSESIDFKFNSDYHADKDMYEKNPIPISIFGSCVSRDLLEFDINKKYDLKTYVARQSIVSAVSTPLKCKMESINLQSKFQKSMVYNDFTKETFEKFNNDGSEYLIIDLIDERFKLLEYKQGMEKSLITYSSLLQESGYVKELNIVEKSRKILGRKLYCVGEKELDYYLQEFCERILKIYLSKKIIIHKCKMNNYYIDSLGNIVRFNSNILRNNKVINELLNYMYDYLEANINGVEIIDICENFSASEKHKWGLAPMHYQNEYYIMALNHLENILNKK
ncbi:hypothetical protein FDC27_05700 [Clostridium botulinum]|uniref:DUF6270 domain-containing protein n=1 Tax=Clostridium botulinum TaxID=1491 RepID=UPI0013C588DB|nr:DUF6270 domain-containing protein [Clostridium botulinum]MBY7026651.1 hypothetical protein [Clostridium botulinum]NFE74259.1 hypothetical protein [Clostridium botulinum]NFL58855.1 hypothetical protein [Clostridium botulinum]NFL61682.1 hypothetical protein [Clostridium botulinum]NFO66472.1 hypothetical protein [Clostridium botulinum]